MKKRNGFLARTGAAMLAFAGAVGAPGCAMSGPTHDSALDHAKATGEEVYINEIGAEAHERAMRKAKAAGTKAYMLRRLFGSDEDAAAEVFEEQDPNIFEWLSRPKGPQ